MILNVTISSRKERVKCNLLTLKISLFRTKYVGQVRIPHLLTSKNHYSISLSTVTTLIR